MNSESSSQPPSIEKENSGGFEQKQPSAVSELACCHPRPEQAIVQPPTALEVFDDRFFALIIGIDDYQNEKIRKLKGCVNDSENVCRFLTEYLHVNPAHIKHLRDGEATRENILSAFEKHFISNQEIQPNDAIVFYFGGHGTCGKHLGGNMLQMICPYDYRMGARGIHDHFIASLMHRLANLKGNNITQIIDSCHSGGMGRIPDLENSRFLAPLESLDPTGLDDDIADRGPSRPTEIDNPLKTHVLLAACQHDEPAYEAHQWTGQYGGDFTSLLLDLLRDPERNLTNTTYIDLFHTMEQQKYKSRLPKQTPYVEGDNKNRILFKTTCPVHHFPVLLHDDESFSVAAGTIHGVDLETEFIITSGDVSFLGLKPHTVSGVRSSFHKLDLDKTLRDDSTAKVIKLNRPLIKVLLKETPGDPSISEGNDVVITPSSDGFWKVERRDKVIPRYAPGFVEIKGAPGTRDTNHAIADAITHFTFHLLHRKPTVADNYLGVKLERLVASHSSPRKISYSPASDGENFFSADNVSASTDNVSGMVSGHAILPDVKGLFSLTLSIKDNETPLFPYVFGFDPSTYTIESFYHPEPWKKGPLSKNQEVTIGHGPEGGDPIEFYPNEVTFFKIFLTTTYVDLKGLEQEPFSVNRKMPGRVSTALDDLWESWIYVVES